MSNVQDYPAEPVPEETFTHSPTRNKDSHKQGLLRGSSSPLWCFEQARTVKTIKPAYNQKSADDVKQPWISMPAVLVTVPNVTQNSLHPLSTSSITARHLLNCMVQGKITEADTPTIHLDYWCRQIHNPPIFMPNALSATTHIIYSGLGQAPNNDGLNNRWLDT